jgi:hypothetical protein
MAIIDRKSIDERLQEIAYKQTAELMYLIEEVLYVVDEQWLWSGELVDLVYFVDKLIELKFVPKPRYVNKFILTRFLWTKGTLNAKSLKTARNRLGRKSEQEFTQPDESLVLLFDLLKKHGTHCYTSTSLWNKSRLREKFKNNIDKEAREYFFIHFFDETNQENINILSDLRERKANGQKGLDTYIRILESKVIIK